MLDPTLIRRQPEQVHSALQRRGSAPDMATLARLSRQRGQLIQEADQLRNRRRVLSESIGQARRRGESAAAAETEVGTLKQQLETLATQLAQVEADWHAQLLQLPNLPHASVPDGADSNDNPELRRVGTPPQPDFAPRDHVALGEALQLLDFDAAARLSGARFAVLRGTLARLHRALIQFMLDLHTETHGYQELNVPHLVSAAAMQGTGQLPKFRDDIYACDDELFLIPTAEVPVTNLVAGRLLEAEELPLRYVCHTPCYRREAGSYGRDTRGLIRVHQFEKVELVQIVCPEDSYATLEQLTGHAEEVLKRLRLPYRVVELCAGDLGFSAAKTYDLEVWMPGQGCYREISSCSNFESFQARRMQARWRGNGHPEPVHTLNGSGVAIGRALVAVMENGQQADGSIQLPEVLHPYMGGLTQLRAAQ